jgi:tetratricopeptide (TPR) repeat protein
LPSAGSVAPRDSDWAFALVLSLAVFALLARGACRTIYVGDSGELVTAVHLLGIPHPSGYPLYVLLGKLWTLLLPVGTVAFRMSLFSAAAAAAACGALYALGRNLTLRPVAALFSAAMLAVAPSFWAEANIQRVYALNALFVVLATTAAWRWCATGRVRALIGGFFLCGLGASNHTYMAVYAAAFAAFALIAEPQLLRRPLALGAGAAAFLAGLVPYVYLPLRSRADPLLDWGNPETLGAFVRVVLRLDFWGRRWLETPADLLAIAADYLRSLGTELAWVGAVLAALGCVAWASGWVAAGSRFDLPGGARRRRSFVLLPVLAMAGNLAALAAHGSRTDLFIWHRYYIPSYAMGALLSGIGCQLFLARVPRRLGALVLVLPAVLMVTGFREHDRSRYRIGEDYSSLVLRSLPPGAHLIAEDDNILFTLMYLHLVENRRPDVDLILQGVGDSPLPPLKLNPDDEPLYFTHHPNWALPSLEIVPLGVVFRACRADGPKPRNDVRELELDGEADPSVPKDYLTQNLIGQFHYMLGVTFEQDDWLRARGEFRKATAASPDNDVLFYNLGLIFRRNGLEDDALAAFRRSDAINPRHLANREKVRASDKIVEVNAERARLAALEFEIAAGDPAIGSLPAASAEYHRRMAELLTGREEGVAARGHRLRALELRAGSP